MSYYELLWNSFGKRKKEKKKKTHTHTKKKRELEQARKYIAHASAIVELDKGVVYGVLNVGNVNLKGQPGRISFDIHLFCIFPQILLLCACL